MFRATLFVAVITVLVQFALIQHTAAQFKPTLLYQVVETPVNMPLADQRLHFDQACRNSSGVSLDYYQLKTGKTYAWCQNRDAIDLMKQVSKKLTTWKPWWFVKT
ncbi:hypothetical protein CBOM_03560 [Ceraceosorus bombacis]|uniref:Uncharacterized protein n=1 Tax=Ceraceosorus bombacis TaxID=401625 RepID=A0A0P1BH30_9BASI|nr:hypothetical protein CBOM_03560 [Ceraceosorus bombacis]